MSPGVEYQRIDDDGLHLTMAGEPQTLAIDQVIVCAGQEPLRELFDALQSSGRPVHLIGGAHEAAELDAKRAILQGARLAATI